MFTVQEVRMFDNEAVAWSCLDTWPYYRSSCRWSDPAALISLFGVLVIGTAKLMKTHGPYPGYVHCVAIIPNETACWEGQYTTDYAVSNIADSRISLLPADSCNSKCLARSASNRNVCCNRLSDMMRLSS